MKTFKTTLLIIAVLLCSISANAYDFEVDGIYYNITSNYNLTVEVTRGNDGTYSGTVTIPSSVECNSKTYSVTSIGDEAFRFCRDLTSITIPNSVTSIGKHAFSDCIGLTSITIPNSVTSIEENAFAACNNITSIDIPHSVTRIENEAFYACYELTSIIIGNSVKYIGEHAFYNCSLLRLVINFSDLDIKKVRKSHGYVGYYADKIINADEQIGDFFFRTDTDGNNYLSGYIGDDTELSLPNDYKGMNYKIESNVFYECENLTDITIPNSVTSIGKEAFYDCTGLTTITIPNSVTNIGSSAFRGCSNLAYVFIPNSVTNIEDYVFYDCPSLELVINFSDLNVDYSADRVINADEQIGDFFFRTDTDGNNFLSGYIGDDTELSLPNDYKGMNYKIESKVFYKCNNLTSITIPESVTSIGVYAFSGCTSLTSITIPNSVTSIGDEAFCACTGLTSITIPNSVTSIGRSAFHDCSNLANAVFENQEIDLNVFENCAPKSLIIGAEVTSISGSFDRGKSPIKTIWLTNTPPGGYSAAAGKINYVSNEQYKFSYNKKYVYPLLSSMFEVDGVTYVPVNMSERTCDAIHVVHNSSVGNMAVNSTVSYKGIAMTVKEVMPYTFCNNDYIKTLSVDNAGNIGEYAFYGCDSLQAVTLGESITNIEKSSFESCSALTKMTIPNSVITLGEYCFRKCTSMQSIELGNGLTTIEKGAFTGCSALSSISIPSSVTKVSDYVFSNCTSMTKVVIEDRTEALSLGSNDSNPLFANCPLNSVYIGGKISYSTSSSWGYSPFYRNTSLESVVISDHENTVYDNEFYGCTGLKNVTIGNGVKSIGKWAFSGCGSLDKFSFGGNVESIGQEAFSDCTGMTELVSYAVVPPTCGAQALEDINKWECTLKVPESCKAAYQEADQWKDFLFTEDVLAAQKYTLTYTVDGKVFHTESIALNAAIPTIETPTKEGYTFSGWSELPTRMPANDVTVEGSFSVNSYRLVYQLDGAEYSVDSVAYGTELALKDALTKEGHTFSGWSELPATMPANDVTVEGSFAVNSYRLVYQLDGAEYSADSIAYGTELVLKDALTKEGHTFSGWSELPATMPANDVTVEGSFMVNKYKLAYVVDGTEYKTVEIAYGASITLEATPTKEGYIFSGWSEIPETMPAKDVVVTGSFTVDGIEAVVSSKLVDVYTLQGVMVKRQISIDELKNELPAGIYIVNGKKFVVK